MINIFYKNKYMKTLIKRSFFILLVPVGMTTLHAQTVDDITAKYVDAIGGKTVLASIKSLTIESSIDVMGQEAPSTTYILVGKGFKSETDIQGQKMVQALTPDGGWMINPMAGSSTAQALPADQAKASIMQLEIPSNPLANYAAKGIKVELIGKDSADFKLQATTPGVTSTYYINMKTYLLDKQVSKISAGGQDVETTVSYSDYKKTDSGYVIANTSTLELPQITLTINIKKVTVNGTIDPAIFAMPK
jgi:hypothetical protein